MSAITRRMRSTVTISTPSETYSGEDDYGNDDETALDYYDTYQARAVIVPLGSTEDVTDRDTQTQDFDLYLQTSTVITGNSVVKFDLEEDREVTCRVMGEPVIHTANTRGLSHKVATVQVVEG